MKVDFHVHTRWSVDAVHSPRQMVKKARAAGIDAIAITDHSRLLSKSEAQRLSREFGLVVIPGIEGGNIALQRHWIALGIDRRITDTRIDLILESIRQDSGVSVAPHPHSRLGYGNYAELGFDAVESLNGSEPGSNKQVRNTHKIPEVAGSDSHAISMLGFCWTEVDADGTIESILESVRGVYAGLRDPPSRSSISSASILSTSGTVFSGNRLLPFLLPVKSSGMPAGRGRTNPSCQNCRISM